MAPVFAAAALLAALPLLRVLIGERQLGTLLAVFIIAACAHALCAQFIRAEGHTALYALQGLLNTALYLALNVLFLAVFILSVFLDISPVAFVVLCAAAGIVFTKTGVRGK